MNLELLESFGQNYPQEFDGSLDCISRAVACQFNRRGTLLAVGCNDGRVVVWDFLTRGIAKIVTAHVHPVCSLSWSRDGRQLLSACTDNTVAVWDVLSGDCLHKYRFPSPVLKVQFNPRDSQQILVCPLKHSPVVVKVDTSTTPATSGAGSNHQVLPSDEDGEMSTTATFDHRGQFIFAGNARGRVLAVSTTSLQIVASFRISGSSTTSLKTMEYSRRGDHLLLNSLDRVIRVFDAKKILAAGVNGSVEPSQKLQDQVNRTMWKKCCFSGDGEYVCAGSARQHELYIWERSVGTLVKILQGTKGELLLDVAWHPVRPIVASISSGVVSVWTQNQVENWSAFAPDFKELDENVEYEERESEFDMSDEDAPVEQRHAERRDEEADVDVVAVEAVCALLSSDEESVADTLGDNHLDYLPVAPEVEEPECGEGPAESPRRRSSHTVAPTSSNQREPPTTRVHLASAPVGETHPLLSNSRLSAGKDKAGKKAVGRHRGDTKRK